MLRTIHAIFCYTVVLVLACDDVDPLPRPTSGGIPVETTGSEDPTWGEEPTSLPPQCEGKAPIIQPSKDEYNKCPEPDFCYLGPCVDAPEDNPDVLGQCSVNCFESADCPQGGICTNWRDLPEVGGKIGDCLIACGPCEQCPDSHSCVEGFCWPKAAEG